MTEDGVRRIGLEQEFFLVDEEGLPSDRADEFLARCWETAGDAGLLEGNFVGECTKGMVEVNTAPAASLADLSREYFAVLDYALRAGREVGIRLYPLAAYPLSMVPPFREEASYELQAEAVGRKRFVHAGRCIGTHIHLEVEEGTVDPETVVAASASSAARAELLDLYNLAVALDPAIVALTRSIPFYEGSVPGVAVRTARYRGSALYGWEGVYTNLPLVGGLKPYAESIDELVQIQNAGYGSWISALARAGLGEDLYLDSGGDLLKAHWGPVRLGGMGTIELRGIDGNYPAVILATVALIGGCANRIRQENLRVRPSQGVRSFELHEDTLLVPPFSYLNADLLHAAVTADPNDRGGSPFAPYLDALLAFAEPYMETPEPFDTLRPGGSYTTTEARLLAAYPTNGRLGTEDGLRLVDEACDELERQVERGTKLYGRNPIPQTRNRRPGGG